MDPDVVEVIDDLSERDDHRPRVVLRRLLVLEVLEDARQVVRLEGRDGGLRVEGQRRDGRQRDVQDVGVARGERVGAGQHGAAEGGGDAAGGERVGQAREEVVLAEGAEQAKRCGVLVELNGRW